MLRTRYAVTEPSCSSSLTGSRSIDWSSLTPFRARPQLLSPTIQHYSSEVIKHLCAYLTASDADPVEALILYLIIFHACSVWELQHAELPTVFPLRQNIASPRLAEAYYVIVPKPPPSLGDRSPGRPDVRLDFPDKAAPWLKPLLERFECQREQTVSHPKQSLSAHCTQQSSAQHTCRSCLCLGDSTHCFNARAWCCL